MGIIEDMNASFGIPVPETEPPSRQNWHGLCVCGHIDRYHSPSTGGIYEIPESTSGTYRGTGLPYNRRYVFHGCAGAPPKRNQERLTESRDSSTGDQVFTVTVTCPCTDMRQIVSVDRPNRYFCQQIPDDPTEQRRHPFLVGVQAFNTHLSRRKAALTNRHWLEQEWERRFRWDETVRNCSISHCRVSGTDVWPTFVNSELLSELRCGAHRRP